jgi:hypothetical protein
LTLRFEFTRTGHLEGVGALYVDDELVGEAVIPHTLPYLISTEEQDMHRRGRGVLRQTERNSGAFSGTITEVVISSAGNPESTRSMRTQLVRIE